MRHDGIVTLGSLCIGVEVTSNVASFDTSLAAFTGYLQLSRFVRVVRLSGAAGISRINWSVERFIRGTIITLINDGTVSIANSVYISLASTWTGATGHSLGLMSNGDGTWVEVYRS